MPEGGLLSNIFYPAAVSLEFPIAATPLPAPPPYIPLLTRFEDVFLSDDR